MTIAHLKKKKLPSKKNYLSKIEEKIETAGHVLLTYKSGGHILTSMGHWIELMKIDASEKKLFELAQEEFGAEMAEEMQNEYNQF